MWMQRISMRQRLIEKYERLRRGPVCEQPCRACHSSCWKHPWKQKRDQFRWSAREAPLCILWPCKKQAENRYLEMNGNEEETKSQVGKVGQEGMVGKNVSRFLPYPTYLTYQTYLTSRLYLTYTPPVHRLLSLSLCALLTFTPFLASAQTGYDIDGDAIPDKDEDVNNNGIVDVGETDWKNADTDNGGEADGTEKKTGRNPFVM